MLSTTLCKLTTIAADIKNCLSSFLNNTSIKQYINMKVTSTYLIYIFITLYYIGSRVKPVIFFKRYSLMRFLTAVVHQTAFPSPIRRNLRTI